MNTHGLCVLLLQILSLLSVKMEAMESALPKISLGDILTLKTNIIKHHGDRYQHYLRSWTSAGCSGWLGVPLKKVCQYIGNFLKMNI